MGLTYDAVVVGSGPNGLTAAVVLAQHGLSVVVFEAAEQIGGGARSAELTLPGFLHDVCSAIHPLAALSPVLRQLSLAEYGLEWVQSPAALAHPLDDGCAVILQRSVDATAAGLGEDGAAYARLMSPLAADAALLVGDLLGPPRLPRHPLAAARFGWRALSSASGLADRYFSGVRARALFAGIAGHSLLPLERRASAAVGLLLAAAGHAVGWPFPRGGAQQISNALASYLRSLGGQIVTSHPVALVDELPPARLILLNVSPRQLLRLAGDRLPPGYRRQLARFRYGPGAFKVDWALDGPIPWKAGGCAQAATVHLGGTLEEIAASERAVGRGECPERPFVLLAQPGLFDASRAPSGKQTAWAYCHVPNGSARDMTERIESQIERFAPGFRERILARHVLSPAGLERYNPNYVGGDINGGAMDLKQLIARPVLALCPYATPVEGLYLCSASTPPGGGVHGLCGYYAAQAALRKLRG